MKYLILLLLSTNMLYSQKDYSSSKHFYAGFTITCGSSLVVNHYIKRPLLSTLIGFTIGSLVGIGKEVIWDRKLGRGTYDKFDMFDTSWGSACGATFMIGAFSYREKKQKDKLNNLQTYGE
jgi:hypothetical protein